MYTVKENNYTSKWEIYEITTDQRVQSCRTKDEARRLTRLLNLGSGFNGFTPRFITVEYI